MSAEEPVPPLDASVAHPARRYNYWLGGKDNFAADRESGDAIERVFPHIRKSAVENRRFLQRAVRYLAADAGVKQFLDIGTGLPTADNTHEIAQTICPSSRIVYVDNDPLVLAHARALLTSAPEGQTAYIEADVRDPGSITGHPVLSDVLDLRQPVAIMLVAVLHFLPDSENVYSIVKTLIEAVPSGSYLALSHATNDFIPKAAAEVFASGRIPGTHDFTGRKRADFERLFDGLEIISPGVSLVSEWRSSDSEEIPPPQEVSVYGAVGVKP
ncbi:SAM-dependent methyltransferase [Actinoplanes sp. NPDC020271]|uniref:SAM-dependent methyltransferase n=1 Tax=Actinoplanes sp. NPDC020271 TaxID=3363896 RepID=UPI0037949810